MIFGADPDAAPTKPPTKKSPGLELLHHFNLVARSHHATPVLSPPHAPITDRTIFLAHSKRLFASGVTLVDAKQMVDHFFDYASHRNHPCPWKLFFSSGMQKKLAQSAQQSVTTDEIFDWVGRDFVRVSPLPWPEKFDRDFQLLVIRTGMEVVYRYPDLVSSIAKISEGDIRVAKMLVEEAARLVASLLNKDSGQVVVHRQRLQSSGVLIPKDLSVRSPKPRPEASNLREAVRTAQKVSPV
jgi:hypothetical protein